MEIENTFLYRYCFDRCISEELRLNLKTELEIVRDSGLAMDWNKHLFIAFLYRETPQGHAFWFAIHNSKLPKEYQ